MRGSCMVCVLSSLVFSSSSTTTRSPPTISQYSVSVCVAKSFDELGDEMLSK